MGCRGRRRRGNTGLVTVRRSGLVPVDYGGTSSPCLAGIGGHVAGRIPMRGAPYTRWIGSASPGTGWRGRVPSEARRHPSDGPWRPPPCGVPCRPRRMERLCRHVGVCWRLWVTNGTQGCSLVTNVVPSVMARWVPHRGADPAAESALSYVSTVASAPVRSPFRLCCLLPPPRALVASRR